MPPRSPPTHFLCIPLVNASSRPHLAKSLGAFTADVTSPTSYGIPPDAIRPVGTLHLTLGIFSCPNDVGLDSPMDLLKALKLQEILASARRDVAARRLPSPGENVDKSLEGQETGPLKITLRGLASMQKASETSVLYAPPVDGEGSLQGFCERLKGEFLEAGLMLPEKRPLLLHATVLNTVYVKPPKPAPGEGKPQKKRWRQKLDFDARGILDRYEDEVWMEGFEVDRVAICRMGAKKIVVDGVVVDEVYEVVAQVSF